MQQSDNSQSDILDHVVSTTGLDRADAEKALAAAFEFVRTGLRAGRDFAHPAFGQIRVVERKTEAGETRTLYRYRPRAQDPDRAARSARRKRRAARGAQD